MTDWLLSELEKMEVGTILVIFAAFWLYDRYIILNRFHEVYQRFDKVDIKFDSLELKFDKKIDSLREEMIKSFKDLKEAMSLEKDITLIKAALTVRNILPSEVASKEDGKK